MARLGLFNFASMLTDNILRHRHERAAVAAVRRVEYPNAMCHPTMDVELRMTRQFVHER